MEYISIQCHDTDRKFKDLNALLSFTVLCSAVF